MGRKDRIALYFLKKKTPDNNEVRGIKSFNLNSGCNIVPI